MSDLQQRMAQAEEAHKARLMEAQNQLEESKKILAEWADKFKKSENHLQIMQAKEMNYTKEIDNLQADKNGLNDMVEELEKKIKTAAEEAETVKQMHEKELFEVNFKVQTAETELAASKGKLQK